MDAETFGVSSQGSFQ